MDGPHVVSLATYTPVSYYEVELGGGAMSHLDQPITLLT
jgi:hypothetical protein